jgi:hypothetical protein
VYFLGSPYAAARPAATGYTRGGDQPNGAGDTARTAAVSLRQRAPSARGSVLVRPSMGVEPFEWSRYPSLSPELDRRRLGLWAMVRRDRFIPDRVGLTLALRGGRLVSGQWLWLLRYCRNVRQHVSDSLSRRHERGSFAPLAMSADPIRQLGQDFVRLKLCCSQLNASLSKRQPCSVSSAIFGSPGSRTRWKRTPRCLEARRGRVGCDVPFVGILDRSMSKPCGPFAIAIQQETRKTAPDSSRATSAGVGG